MKDSLKIGNRAFSSRLLTGSGKYFSDSIIPEITNASGTEIITVALRRVDLNSPKTTLTDYIPKHITIMPNTSGARDAQEAVKIARIARAAGCGTMIKIEVISDNKYLLPDGYETLKATEILAKEGFTVMPYINADLYLGRSLKNAGAAALMPLGSPIGSNRGIKCLEMINILIDQVNLPIIVDAGIGKPSDAAKVMEIGAAACLVNSAIATSGNPIQMAKAFKKAIEAGREAYLSGLGLQTNNAIASSPLTGFLYE